MKIAATVIAGVLALGGATAVAAATGTGPFGSGDDAGGSARKAYSSVGLPKLEVTRVVAGLDHPWDVRSIGAGRLLVTQRDRATLSVVKKGRIRPVAFPSSEVWVSGETGLMGLAVDPAYAKNRRIYTCQGGFTAGGGHDVRVVAWKLDKRATTATQKKTLVGGFPTSSGRHGGCRLLVASDGSLYVGTGDAAQGTNPQDLTSLGGKTLRLDRFSGNPWPTNPFITAGDPAQRYVHSFGHRNIQGLDERADGSVWTVEHGTFRDDEVNRLVVGGDYGYNPVPGYNEEVPMTDQGLPGTQVEAAWSSGDPTIAPGGATFVRGARWGKLQGSLAMAVLKDQEVLFLSFSPGGGLTSARAPQELQRLGRVRTVVSAPDGSLLVTTDNGDGADAIYRVRPR